MPKCIVMNVEYPKNKTFEVCVNGERFSGDTDVEIDLKEMFICALENAVVETMIPDPSKTVKMGEVYKIPKREPRFRVVRLEKIPDKKYVALEEGVSPVGKPIETLRKPKGNPNWRKKHIIPEPVESETGHQLTEV